MHTKKYLVLLAVGLLFGCLLAPAPAMMSESVSITTKFAAVGDWSCNTNTQGTVSNIQQENVDAVVALGDLSYTTSQSCWFNIVAPIDDKMHVAIGNHDVNSRTELMNHYGLGNTYYAFDENNVHFIVIDSDLPYGIGSAQYNFVKNDLISASSDTGITWIVASFHKPIYTSPSEHGPEISLRDAMHPLFDQYGVDLVLEGHNHNYMRTYPLNYNPTSPSSPTVTSTNPNNYVDPQGQLYVMVGTGGRSFYQFSSQSTFSAFQFTNYFGALYVTTSTEPDGDEKLDGKFISNGASHTPRDSFSITKTGVPTGGYHYEPTFTATGNNFKDTASTPSLQVNTFTVAAWFKNSRDSTQAYSFIVNKGGIGTDTNGKNMNFGLWLDSSERLKGGFETSTGADVFIRGPASYRDNAWHYAVLTYTGSVIQLYVDGQLVATKVQSTGPETVGTGPVRIGANSHSSGGYYLTGSIDEVRLWNQGMSSTQIQSQFGDGIFNTPGQVLYLQFD